MHIELTDAEVQTLRDMLDVHLGDMSAEIAATDNPGYRRGLRERRDHLTSVRAALAAAGTGDRTQAAST